VDPDGYLPRDEIVAHLERYARGFDAPVREGVDVTALRPAPGGGFAIDTSAGTVAARAVVVASGAYQRPNRPRVASTLPAGPLRLDADDYRNPGSLPSGPVLVVGSGQSGCQIAEELLDAGREVFLSCGRAPWVPRRLGEHDAVWWAVETGYLDQPVASLPVPEARLAANLQGTGRDGGHDLNYRTLRAAGVTLLGRFLGAEGRRARFAGDLGASVAWGDERYRQFAGLVRGLVAERGLPMPDIPEPQPFDAAAPDELDLSGFGAVVFAGGYRPAYGEWVHVDGAFDPLGFPVHVEGESVAAPGLFFVGVHFLRTRKSSLLVGVGEDAAIVASGVLARLAGGTA
jgi:putative flavoprotein involved in K+ transport